MLALHALFIVIQNHLSGNYLKIVRHTFFRAGNFDLIIIKKARRFCFPHSQPGIADSQEYTSYIILSRPKTQTHFFI